MTVNAAVLEDLQGGATSIAQHEATPGGSGLPLDGHALAGALDQVLLDVCPIALIAGERTREAAAALDAVWNARAIAPDRRLGHYNGDPLGIMAIMGGLSLPIEDALADAARLTLAAQSLPGVTALIADGNAYHGGGASEAQEMAAMLATLVAYLRVAEAAGIAPDRALPKIALALAADTDLFLTIAKLRAARRLVWRVADAAGAGEAAAQVHLTAVTAWRMMTKRDPWSNMLRTTMATTAAALGGADAITVLPFTYVLGQPDGLARRMARNTQLVLMEESGLGRVLDAAGGSWYVEQLTGQLAHKAWELFQAIEAQGGMARALASGFVQDAIAKTAAARAEAIATGTLELTGVSVYPRLGDDGVTVAPWAKGNPASQPKAITVRPLTMRRLAEPFERLRDTSDAFFARTGKRPQVLLIRLGTPADHDARAAWITNLLATGGIEAESGEPITNSPDAGRVLAASAARVACICGADADYALLGEAVAMVLKEAGAGTVALAGRPTDQQAALTAAGVDLFLHAGCDAPVLLDRLLATLTAQP